MKAVVLTEPGRLEACERPEPGPPLVGQALVRVRRVGVCGTDIHAFRGRQPFFSYPRVLGHELAVEVLEVNVPASALRPGDLCAVEPYLNCQACRACEIGKPNCCQNLQVLGVHQDGGMLPLLRLPLAKLHPAPALAPEQAALVETLAIGCHAVERSRPQEWPPNARLVVVGAGPIGLAVLQFVLLHAQLKRDQPRPAQLSGVQVSVLDTSPQRLAFCREQLGIRDTLAPGQAQGQQFDVVFDATGSPASMSAAFERVQHGGTLVFVGLCASEVSFHDPLLHRREITLLASRNALARDFTFIIDAITCGRLDTTPWITHRAAFADFPAAFPGWLEANSGLIKGIIEL